METLCLYEYLTIFNKRYILLLPTRAGCRKEEDEGTSVGDDKDGGVVNGDNEKGGETVEKEED